jgi:hypothetical protein
LPSAIHSPPSAISLLQSSLPKASLNSKNQKPKSLPHQKAKSKKQNANSPKAKALHSSSVSILYSVVNREVGQHFSGRGVTL